MIKDRLFYDRFDYCLSFSLDEVSCLRELDHARIDDNMQRRKTWREISQQRWQNSNYRPSTIMRRGWKEITDQTVQNLHILADALLTANVDFKLVVSVNRGWVYSNDLNFLQQIDQLSMLDDKTYSRVQINRPKDTVLLKRSKYQYRSYFRALALTVQQRNQLEEFLLNQRDHLRISPALMSWIDLPFNRLQDYFFVDHDSAQWVTMIGLVLPGSIRKTMQIITDK